MNVNAECLKQARDMIQRVINESPQIIVFERKPMKDDGFSGEIEDPYGEPVEHEIRCRLSHEKKFPGNFEASPVGFTSNLARYILVNYKTTIYEGDRFDALGKGFRIGVIDILKKFDGIIGYQAPLIEAPDMGGQS